MSKARILLSVLLICCLLAGIAALAGCGESGNGDEGAAAELNDGGAAMTTVPSVATSNASNFTTTSAKLNGSLTSLGTATSVSVSFQWGTASGSYPNETTTQAMTGTGAFSYDLTGLIPGTVYSFRAKAVGDVTLYGHESNFFTTAVVPLTTPPSVTTSAATDITTTSAKLNGDLTSLGTATSVSVSLEWGTTSGSYTNETTAQDMTSAGVFSSDLTGLTPGTTYYFSAKAVGNGTSYGYELSFAIAQANQWNAYDFGGQVNPMTGESGSIKTFTINETYTENGQVMELQIDGEYLGIENAQIETTRMDMSDYSETIVTNTLECYKVKHRITVTRDDSGASHPAWAEITLWIPTSNLESSVLYFWIYPKAEYTDFDGKSGTWSYYLTPAMETEMNSGVATYLPHSEGDFSGYDASTFYGLYGWGWFWFQAYAEGGTQNLEEGSYSVGGYSYLCSASTQTIGSYEFGAWTVTTTAPGGVFTGSFSPDLPLPIHLKVGASGGGSGSSWEYTLTAITLG